MGSIRYRYSHLLLFIPSIFLLIYLRNFLFISPSTPYSDLTIAHYPNLIFLVRSLKQWGQIPLWSPAILSGFPYVANPLSGLWYVPGWVAILLPAPIGFNLLAAFHLVFGAIGMKLFLSHIGLRDSASLFAAVAFGSLPKLIAHYSAGHISILYAVTWTPWLLLAEGRNWRLFPPGLVLAVIFYADPRWAAFAGVLWLVWSASKKVKLNTKSIIGNWGQQTALSAGLVAPQLIPLLEYANLSTRSTLSPEEIFAFSLPPERILGLIFPDFGGNHEWIFYPGGMVLLLFLLAVYFPEIRSRIKIWIWIAGVSLLFSLGDNFPFMRVFAYIPGINLFRVPSRALFITGISLVISAGIAFDSLLHNLTRKQRKRANYIFVGLVAFVLALLGGIRYILGNLPLNFAWGGGVVVACVFLLRSSLNRGFNKPLWFGLVLLISLLDWGFVNLKTMYPRSPTDVFSQGQQVGEFLAEKGGHYRVYSPSYSVPQHTAAKLGLELADGVDPLQFAGYAAFMDWVTGVPREGYSVTLPPFDGEVSNANASYTPDPVLLGLLNVRYVVAEFDISVDGLVFLERFGQSRVYENAKILPRAWVQPLENNIGVGAEEAQVSFWSPNRIEISADGPGLLVASELNYPGWLTYVDGQRVPLIPVIGLLRGVELDPGSHEVELVFFPTSLKVGLVVFCLTIIISTLRYFLTRKPGRDAGEIPGL